jgi:hypothetical protein
MDKPMYVGMAILEISKLHMYEFFYDILKPRFGNNIRLAYSDTDSFILFIYTSNLERHLKKLREHFDFSNYPTDHPLYSNDNNKVLGKFKDETASKVILKYVGLRPKCYAIRLAGDEKLTCKGIKKTTSAQNYIFPTTSNASKIRKLYIHHFIPSAHITILCKQ